MLDKIDSVNSSGSVFIATTSSGSDLTDNFSTRGLTVDLATLANFSQNVSRFGRMKSAMRVGRFRGGGGISGGDLDGRISKHHYIFMKYQNKIY